METDTTAENFEEPLNETEDAEITDVKQSTIIKTQSSISQKKQPDLLCNCPLHCDTKIGKEWRQKIYQQFGELGDHALQNQYIQRHIKIKSVNKRLWEDEVIDKKIQRRVTCKYLIPVTGSVKDSYSYSKTLDYESVKFSLDNSVLENSISKTENSTPKTDNSTTPANENGENVNSTDSSKETPPSHDVEMKEVPQCNGDSSIINGNTGVNSVINGNASVNNISMDLDSTFDSKNIEFNSTKENISDVNSPLSFNDNESINTADETALSELDTTTCTSVKYVEVCQKAFMNMYGITEKRIRWQREKLILRSRYMAEKEKKELEEMDRTLSLARSLGAGCQPLFAFLERSNCKQLSEQLLVAIEDDVRLVNNFFHNQLWKPEDIMNKSVHFSTLDSCETECDQFEKL